MALNVRIALPDGRTVPLSEIERDRSSRAKYLERYHGNSGEVLCLCRHEGIPLGVGRRQVPYLLYYFYPLHRSDPPRHAFGCPLRAEVKTTVSDSDTVPTIQVDEGKIRVNLGSPLYRGKPTGARTNEVESQDDAERSPSPRGKLLTLLEVLWSQAELNIWRPWFAGKRYYGVVVRRLQEAAANIRVRRQDLSPLLFVPSPYRQTDEAALREKRERFLEALREKDGKTYYGYVLALFREVIEQDGGNAAIKLYNAPFKLWIPKTSWQHAERRWFPGSKAAAPAALLARVSRREGGSGPWLAVEDVAFMPLSDEESYIPVDSSFERELTLKLVAEHRQIRKPLACEVGVGEIIPDFILEDREDRFHLEVLGRMTEPAYRDQVIAKKAYYANAQQPVWWWDTEAQKEIPTLPVADRRRGRPAPARETAEEESQPAP